MTPMWESKPLGELVDFQRGLTYAKSDEVASSRTVVLRATNIDLSSHALDMTDLRYISDGVDVPRNKIVRKDSLLICTASGSKSHLGKVALIDEDYGYAFGGFMGMLTPRPSVVPKYLFYALISPGYKQFIDDLADGANINNLKFADLGKFTVVVPSLAEQKRIVAILDQAFEAIDAAKANSEKSELNAKELFSCVVHESLDRLRRESSIVSVAELVRQGVLEKPQDGNHGEKHPTRAEYVSQGVPFVMAADLQASGVNTVTCRFISKTRANSLRIGFAMNGDVLLSHKGTIGRVAVLDTDLDHVMLTPQVTYYRVLDRTRILNRYLYFYFQSEPFQVALAQIAGAGSTRAYIGITRQLDLEVLVPPLLKQAELVERLTKLEPVCAALSDNYRKKLEQTELLRQALLAATFAGNSRAAA